MKEHLGVGEKNPRNWTLWFGFRPGLGARCINRFSHLEIDGIAYLFNDPLHLFLEGCRTIGPIIYIKRIIMNKFC